MAGIDVGFGHENVHDRLAGSSVRCPDRRVNAPAGQQGEELDFC